MTKQAHSGGINVQDPFFYQLRKDGQLVHVFLISGKRLTGVLRRFDRYALVLETQGQEQLVYKHAIANVVPANPYTDRHGATS